MVSSVARIKGLLLASRYSRGCRLLKAAKTYGVKKMAAGPALLKGRRCSLAQARCYLLAMQAVGVDLQ